MTIPYYYQLSIFLEFELFASNHTGRAIANKVYNALNKFDLVNSFQSITLDNASNNDSAMTYLDDKLPVEIKQRGVLRVRCCVHVCNLK